MMDENTITPPGQVEEKEELGEIARKWICTRLHPRYPGKRNITIKQAGEELASLLPHGHATREIIMDVALEMQAENKGKQA